MTLVALLNVYLFRKYEVGQTHFTRVTLQTNIRSYQILAYMLSSDQLGADVSYPIKPKVIDGVYEFELPAAVRNLRFYVGIPIDTARVADITFYTGDEAESMPLSTFILNGIQITEQADAYEFGFTSQLNGYFQLARSRISVLEWVIAELVILIFAAGFLPFLKVTGSYFKQQLPSGLQAFSVCVFLFCIFLPHPLFNIAFIGSVAAVIRGFSWERFRSNTAGLLFSGYFLVVLLNNLFVSESFNFRIIDTQIPVLLLPLYMACIPRSSYLQVLVAAAVYISLGMAATSLVDYSILRTLSTFSFDAFTKYVHPVYFSYLLVFAVIFMLFTKDYIAARPLLLTIVLLALICCGSKLLICFTLMLLLGKFLVSGRWKTALLFMVASIIVLLIWTPTSRRFAEILRFDSLSILKEPSIDAAHDERVNGLTLRLMIWQETVRAVDDPARMLLGCGSDKKADDMLVQRLKDRGLTAGQVHYDPHNQYLTTYFRLGILGLLFLLGACVCMLYYAGITTNVIFLLTLLLFMVSMCTESVLQRIVGINFFMTVLLLQCLPNLKSKQVL